MKRFIQITMIVVLTLLPLAAFAGNPDSPGEPTTSAGHMPTLEELYNYLIHGTPPGEAEPFREPPAGPGDPGTAMKTLKDIFDAFKALGDGCTATPADVRRGVTFFSTASPNWGPQPGTGMYTGGGLAAVPKTGQVISYATGDDGHLEKGVGWPWPRFTENGDGTVTDNLTELIWLQKANCIHIEYPGFDTCATTDGAVNWQRALDFVAGINAGVYSNCGGPHTDWRLPNVRELFSLIDFSQHHPALPPSYPFSGVGGWYWSSTTYANSTIRAWIVSLDYGYRDSVVKMDTPCYLVWPVRGGE